MDDPGLPRELHDGALRGLARLNVLGNAVGALWPEVERELVRRRGRLVLLDVACGSGDVLAGLARRGGRRLRGIGLDVSSLAVERAKQCAMPGVEFRVQDVLDPGLPLPMCDIALCSLFLHHLSVTQGRALLARMAAAARRLVIVSDLERSPASWWLVWLGARLVTRSPVVHSDSAASVEAAWTMGELHRLAGGAGLRGVRVRRAFPARLVLVARGGASPP